MSESTWQRPPEPTKGFPMDATSVPPELVDRRVLFQYLDPNGDPHFEFTTYLSRDEEHARATCASAHQRDVGFGIVQVVVSDGTSTGFSVQERQAAIVEYARRVNDTGQRVD